MDNDYITAHVQQLIEDAENWKHRQVIVSETSTNADAEPVNAEVTEEPLQPPPIYKRRIPLTWAVICSLLFLCLSLIITLVVQWVFLPTATITIIPKTQKLTTTSTIPGNALQARQLQQVSLTASQTVPTTGRGHQHASASHGLVTFYNALPATQTIPAGTILTGKNGIQIATEQEAIIPPGSLSSNGAVSVPAHSLLIGANSNIAAGDVQGTCCKAYVLVYSGAFSGGADNRDFATVTQADISNTVTTLTKQLANSMQTMLTNQLLSSESIVTPLSCTPHVTTDHKTGEAATNVAVTVKQECSGIAYNTQALQQQVTEQFSTTVTQQFPGYSPTGTPQIQTISTTNKNNSLRFSIQMQGNCVYQFRDSTLHTLADLLRGKSKEEALVLLLHYSGVQSAGITLSGITNRIPDNPANIHFLVMTP